jgi:putative membrane protein
VQSCLCLGAQANINAGFSGSRIATADGTILTNCIPGLFLLLSTKKLRCRWYSQHKFQQALVNFCELTKLFHYQHRRDGMKSIKNVFSVIGCVVCVSMTAHVFAADIDADDFVDEASAKGIAEVEAGKLALQKSTSSAVKSFAQKMIDDHTKANAELTAIAKTKKLEVASESELKNKAKAFILKQRDGESFDEAYANNQVMAHEETIELFKKGLTTDDPDISAYARSTLPKLEHHLQMAQDLARQTKKSNGDDDDLDNDLDDDLDDGELSNPDGRSHSTHSHASSF